LPEFLDDLKQNLDEITASLKVHRRTSAGEDAFRQILSCTPDCRFLQDRDMRFTWFSQELPFGIDATLLLGKTEDQIFSPPEAQRLRRIKEQIISTGRSARTEVPVTIQGKELYLDCIYHPWQDGSGKILGLAGYARDVTEQKIAEIEIRKMTKAVDTAPTAIVLTDLEGRIEYVNRNLLESSGFCDASLIMGRSVSEFTSTDGKSKLFEEIIPALQTHGQWRGELPIKRSDGKTYTAEMICSRVLDDSGKPTYLLANFYNITDRMRAEEALLLDDSRLEALLKLNQMDEASMQEITDFALQAGVKLTGSRVGYLAFVDEEEKILVMHHWSREAMQECDIDQKKMVYLLEETGLWGEAVRQRRAVITNDYPSCTEKRGLPPGHVPVLRHMNVPIMDKGRIVLVAGVGNKEDEYNGADVRQLTLLMGGMWKIIQRRRAEEELHRRDLLLQGVARATNYLLTPDPNAVQEALGILGIAADVDRVQMLENLDPAQHEWLQSQPLQWFRVPAKPFTGDLSRNDLFREWQETLALDNCIQGNTSRVPAPGRKILEANGIRSFLLVPIFIEGRFYAVICFENCHAEKRWIDNEITILQAAAGSIGDAIMRKRTLEALKESQRTLSTLMSNLPGMAYRCKNDSQWTMEFVSDGCLELTGNRSEDLLYNNLISYSDLIYSDDRNYVWNEVQEAIAERRPFQLVYRIKTCVGIKWVMEQGQGIFTPEGELLALEGFVNDITERKLAEEALKRTQEELEKRVAERTAWLLRANSALQEEMVEHKKTERALRKAQQAADAALRAKSDFLANMSHEIRTPMNSVIGLAGLLLDTDLTLEQRDFVETIYSSGDALLAIINDILDFSKIEEGRMLLEHQPFVLRDSLESSLDMVAAKAAEKGLELTYAVDDGVPETIMGDSTRLRQVLANLLSNAVKFTESGSIMIRVQLAEDPDEIHFKVSDTGIGISPNDMDKLFQSFSQVDASISRKYGGTGLGLAISRRLVELMGGKIWAESEQKMGSTFHFKIKAVAYSGDVPDPHLAGKRIMALVGSEDCLRELVTIARSLGVQIHPVISALEARELAQGRFDAAILDVEVPGARDLAEEIRKRLPTITLGGPGQHRTGQASLSKPVTENSIISALQDALHPKNYRMKRISCPPAEHPDLAILLAEDNLVNQKVALLMLNKLGYKADVASSGREAVQAVQRKYYDVILMDVQMPDMDGLEATRAILDMNLDNRPRILATTAYALEGDKERCLNAGMDGYISKPVQMEELRSALEGATISDQRKRANRT
jgi:PAS domain S-box-containing protein